MEFRFIDCHTHANSYFYQTERDEVIERALREGVGLVNIGTELCDSKENVELARRYDGVYAAVGQHPTTPGEFDYGAYLELAKDSKVVAIGECGLDYYRPDNQTAKDKERQRRVFEAQIKLAEETGKALMLHLRTGEAYDEAIKILATRPYQGKVIFHFFVGNSQQLEKILNLSAETYFTIGGVATFARDYDEVIKAIPQERLLAETDAPFLAPEPNRGRRNEPAFIEYTVRKLAEIRGEAEGELREVLVANAKRVLGLE